MRWAVGFPRCTLRLELNTQTGARASWRNELAAAAVGPTGAMAKTQIGTPYYVSPELWKNRPYNAKSDVWALGCLLYEMVMGKPPFDSNNMRGLARKVMRGVYPDVSSRYSQELRDVVKRLLTVDPNHRPSIDQVTDSPVCGRGRHQGLLRPST